jgi:hypothetical protein
VRDRFYEVSDFLRYQPPSAAVLDVFDWYAFVCHWCGERSYVGRGPGQGLAEFAQMCMLLFGEPPVCSSCLRSRCN